MEKQLKKIALTGGGTGWHTMPLVSVYNFIKESQSEWELQNDYDFVWVWELDSLEQDIAEQNNIDFLDISAGKIRRYFDMRNFYEPLKNFTWFFEWLYYIWKYKIDIVFSKWWYVSLPLSLAAWVMRKPIYIHESDTVTWLANAVISKVATKVFYSFENTKTSPQKLQEQDENQDESAEDESIEKVKNTKHIQTWPILNPELIDGLRSLNVKENERFTVIVMWGSQGSATIFGELVKILPDMQDVDFHVILWEKNLEFRNEFKKFPNVTLYDFITQKDLGKLLKKVDIAVTRGSSALWEFYFFGIHSIIIPLRATGGDHQQHNAEYFQTHFWSDILDEERNLSMNLFRKLQQYKDMRKSWLNMDGFFDGIKTIQKEMNL